MTEPENLSVYLQVKELYSAALDVDTGSREDFLSKNCIDPAIRCEIDSLFRARLDVGEFLDDISAVNAVKESFETTATDRHIGQLIGKYRIIREIGRGGMGVVFLAEREDFQHQVALKIIKRGMDSDAILQRFFRERQILASLNHPNIAKLLDGGTTDEGLPFFVLEHVDGQSIEKYCKDLKEKEILRVFQKVCSAISFAHQKLTVHRDLKPSNILINSDGEPKLLDFGIAKLLDQTGAVETQPNQRVLTPAYASPEQISGAIVGTASDVFSLGKILAELFKRSSAVVAQRTRKVDVDLQNILDMAVRDDLDLRYGSVERFSDDIDRYLQNLPVSAHRLSYSYRAKKFVQRNKAKAVLAVLLFLSLIGGLTATIIKANEARHERELAEKRFENLRKLSDSFVTEIHGAIQNLPGSLPARQLLLRRATEQLDALAEESNNNRSLQAELAEAYFNLASLPDMQVDEKAAVFHKEIAIYEDLLQNEPNNPEYLKRLALVYVELGDTAKVRGSVADGLELGRSAVAIFERIAAGDPDNIPYAQNLRSGYLNLARFYFLEGNADESVQASRKALEIGERLRDLNDASADETLSLAQTHMLIGTALTTAGDYKTAIVELQTGLDTFAKAQTEKPNDTSINYYLWAASRRLAVAAELDGDRRKALNYANQALQIIESLLKTSGKDIGYHRNTAITHILIGQMLMSGRQPEIAVVHFRRALNLSEQVLVSDSEYFESKIDVARSKSNLGNALIKTGKKDEGLNLLRDSLRIYEQTSLIDVANAELQRDYASASSWLTTEIARSNPTIIKTPSQK